jgi:hypothetical protein
MSCHACAPADRAPLRRTPLLRRDFEVENAMCAARLSPRFPQALLIVNYRLKQLLLAVNFPTQLRRIPRLSR